MELPFETLHWEGGIDGCVSMIDQRLLPDRFENIQCETPEQLFEAIQTLAVRGAPAIGVAAAYGVCIGAQSSNDSSSCDEIVKIVEKTAEYLAKSRPTAVNLFWALDCMKAKAIEFAQENPGAEAGLFRQFLLEQAKIIHNEDKQMCKNIGQNGQFLIPEKGAILTHCNAGALATGGIGTALSPMYIAHSTGKKFRVYVDETRPLLQGSRLTAWELDQAGIDAVLICDNMAASLMHQRKINAIITGADRIAANGDSANKIGTLGLSILAKYHNIPFYIAAPSSTFDLSISDGKSIPIEQRSADEVRCPRGLTIAPTDINVYNPAFDVTDAENITAIITEKTVIHHPNTEKIAEALK